MEKIEGQKENHKMEVPTNDIAVLIPKKSRFQITMNQDR